MYTCQEHAFSFFRAPRKPYIKCIYINIIFASSDIGHASIG